MIPTPKQIRAARKAAGLTQKEAAALIGKSQSGWQKWETDEGKGRHRRMDAALFDYWMIKVKGMR